MTGALFFDKLPINHYGRLVNDLSDTYYCRLAVARIRAGKDELSLRLKLKEGSSKLWISG